MGMKQLEMIQLEMIQLEMIQLEMIQLMKELMKEPMNKLTSQLIQLIGIEQRAATSTTLC